VLSRGARYWPRGFSRRSQLSFESSNAVRLTQADARERYDNLAKLTEASLTVERDALRATELLKPENTHIFWEKMSKY
jgi:hypothetical protein